MALGRLQFLIALQATVVCLEQMLRVACCWLGIVIVGALLNDLTTFGADLWICPGAVRKSCCWLVSVILRSELRTKLPAQGLQLGQVLQQVLANPLGGCLVDDGLIVWK